jgi:SAM-dependent methyltransferase
MLLGRFGFDKATYCPFEAQLSFDLFFGRNFVERRRRDAREARELVGRYYPGGLMARCLIARVRERRWEEEAEDCVERWREMVRERLITRGQMGSWVDRLYWSRPEFR